MAGQMHITHEVGNDAETTTDCRNGSSVESPRYLHRAVVPASCLLFHSAAASENDFVVLLLATMTS